LLDYAAQVPSDQPVRPAETPLTPLSPVKDGVAPMTVDDARDPFLPQALRGYDKHEVDRYIARVAEAYKVTLEKNRRLRDQVRTLQADLQAANLDAQASAKAVRELMDQTPAENAAAKQKLADLEQRYQEADRDRQRALGEVRELSEKLSAAEGRAQSALNRVFENDSTKQKIAELSSRYQQADRDRRLAREQLREMSEKLAAAEARALSAANRVSGSYVESDPASRDKAAQVLIAATVAAADIRDASRSRALRTLTKARALSVRLRAQIEQEQADLRDAEQRRLEVERDVERMIISARAEANRTAAAVKEERERVQGLLRSALALLEGEDSSMRSDLVLDLGLRNPQSVMRRGAHPKDDGCVD